MIEPVQVLWSPAGTSMPSLGDRALVDVTDGDTPNIRMPIRMLSVDTPEITARTPEGAAAVDAKFAQLAEWIDQGKAPISAGLAADLHPRLATGRAGTLQFEQGTQASAFEKHNIDTRLTRPNGSRRNLFIRVTDTPFDDHGRLLAYIAPNYSPKELETLSRAERSTFNLDLLTAGWAAPFVIFPSIPGELDLPLLVGAAAQARAAGTGIWSDPATLPAYEYRAMEKLYSITKKIVAGEPVRGADRFAWRDRYCADMRSRQLHGPEDYVEVPPEYRLWIWSRDVAAAVDRLNLVPAPALVGAA